MWQTADNPVGTWAEAGLFDYGHNLWAHALINMTVASGEAFGIQWLVQFIGD